MANPTLKVEISFVSDPLATSPTWVDVSAYVRNESVSIRRGRNDPWSPYTPGRCELTLSNRDRRFDPKYSSGPYYGNLKPKRQIRVTATYSATDYVMFTGWITAFPQNYRGAGRDAIVNIVAYDALEWCSGVRLTSDPFEDYILDGGPTINYWLRHGSGSLWYAPYSSTYGASRVGPEQSPGTSLAPGLKSTPIVFGGQNYYTNLPGSLVASGTWGVGFWIQTNGVSQTISDYYDTATDARRLLSIDASGCLSFRCGTSTNYSTVVSATAINDSQPHFVVLYSDSVDASFYIDGQSVTSTTTDTGTGADFDYYAATAIGATTPTSGLFTGTLQEFIIFSASVGGDVELTAAIISAMYDLGRGIAAESTAARMTRYLDDAGWPSAWRNISADIRAICGPLAYNGQELLTALREVESTEQGKVFAAKNGYLTLLSRYAHQEVTRNSTVQATFSDDGSDFKYSGEPTWVEDDLNVRNDITVQTPGTQSRAQDSTSQTAYGRRSETVNTVLSSYEQCRDMAAGLVYWWKDASTRLDPFDVAPLPTNNWATLLGLELGDKIQFEITPMSTGSQAVMPLLIDSIEWSIRTGKWQMRLGGSPVPPSFFMLGTSSLGGADVLGF